MGILVSAHQIEKAFADRVLFKGLSLGIDEGQRIGLVGPNGAGKSTLLKILSGQLAPDQGQVTVKKGLRIGFLAQIPTFRPQARILDTILETCADRNESMSLALTLAAQMELDQFGHETPVEKLSGGWKKRLALARELVQEPELLLMDEPTNHLDLAGIFWLESLLESAKFSTLMVTHDRLFLQRVANRIWDLDPRNPNGLLNVPGDYAKYLEIKEQELAAQKRHEQVEKNRLRRETEWLRRGSLARHTKQSARIEATHDLADQVRELKAKNLKRDVALDFGESEHAPRKLIEARGIAKTYGDRTLFADLDLLITPKTRLGLLGNNGCGKSTLIRVLLGEENPDRGTVKRADGMDVAYFEQSRETLDPTKSVLRNLCPEGDYVNFQGQSVHVRSYLDRFYFSGYKAELPVAKLSGGEQARLRLAQLLLKRAQVLVLDEPTNDLDIDMLESLETALKEFAGAVILVTHDRYFMDAVAADILSFDQDEAGQPLLQRFAGYLQWEAWYLGQQKKRPRPAANATPSASASAVSPTAPPATPSPKPTRLSYKEKFELEKMEETILKLESELADLESLSQSAEVLSNPRRLGEVHQALANLQLDIEQKYQRWNELSQRG